MPNEQLVSEFFDLSALDKEAGAVVAKLRALEEEYKRLGKIEVNLRSTGSTKEIATGINEASAAMAGFAAKVKEVEAHEAKLNQTAKAAVQANIDQANSVRSLSDAYEDLVKASVANQLASKQMLDQRKALQAAFKAGKISEDEYHSGLDEVRKAQLRLSTSNQEINRALRNMGKEADGAEGSLNKLRAQLNLSLQAFDRLSDAERKSAIGTQLKGKIQDLTREISEQENITGRFQRNVGNYKSALDGLGAGIGGIVTNLAAAGVGMIGLNSIGNFLSDAIDEFNEAEAAASRLQNILSNIGRIDAFDRLNEQATEFANTYRTLDNDEILQVFDKLVVYGKLTENQIRSLTPVIIDFAAKQKISLGDATSVIVKALEGNGRALKEYGIDMKDAGSVTEGLSLIMTKLKPVVEGAAEAFGKTMAGEIAKGKQEVNNLKEEIGGKLQPVLGVFYKTLSGLITDIGQKFDFVRKRFSDTIAQVKIGGRILADFFTGNFAGASAQIGVAKAYQEINKQNAQSEEALLKVRQKVNDFMQTTSVKPLEDQKRLLKENLTLQQEAAKAYNILISQGKKNTDEGRKASLELVRTSEVVGALQNSITNYAKANAVLGNGDPNKSKNAPGKAKTEADLTKEILAENEKRLRAESDLNRLVIDEDAKSQERIIANEKGTLIERLAAINQFVKDKQALVQLDTNFEIEAIDAKLKAISAIENKPAAKRTNEENKFLFEKEGLIAKRLFIERKGEAAITDIARDGSKRRLEVLKSNSDQEAKARTDAHQRQANSAVAAYDAEVLKLEESYRKRLELTSGDPEKQEALTKELNERKLKLFEDFTVAQLKRDIEFTEETIQLAKARGEDVTGQEATLAAIRMRLSDALTKRIIDNNKKQTDSEKTRTEKTIEFLDKVVEVYDDVQNLLGGVLNASAIKTKNDIQEEIELIDERKRKEIDAINATTLSQEEKANRIQVINATADAQREQQELKQRQAEQRRAQFEKVLTVGAILARTALAVVTALGAFPFTPANIATAAYVGAIGVANAGIAAATPVPKYKHGKPESNTYQGPAIWGDGGKSELKISKDGSMEVGPAYPALTYVKSTDVIHHDANEYFRNYTAKTASKPVNVTVNNDNREIKKELRGIKTAIENKPVPKVINTWNGAQISFESQRKYLEWINRNF